jgi:hypothetical protein
LCVVWKLKQDVVGSNSVVWKSLAWGVQVTIRYLHTNVSWHAAPHLSNTNTPFLEGDENFLEIYISLS